MKSIKKIIGFLNKLNSMASVNREDQMMLFGKLLAENVKLKKDIGSLKEVEFKIFSQFGDDGIIQWLAHNVDFPHKTFVEFGVGDYSESNTRFLMMNDNWSGFIMEGSKKSLDRIKDSSYFWRYELFTKQVFIDRSNINDLLSSSPFGQEVDLLHIDLDGNDYWIWKEIQAVSPVLVIMEYNSVFGIDNAITIPYDKDFERFNSHYSGLYWGASLKALNKLAEEKGYSFVGSNSAGNNAYFIRNDKLNDSVKKMSVEEGYVCSKYRESRSKEGKLTYLSGADRKKAIQGMPVYNVETREIETL